MLLFHIELWCDALCWHFDVSGYDAITVQESLKKLFPQASSIHVYQQD